MCFPSLLAQWRITLTEVTEIYVGRGIGWMNADTLMWDQGLSSASAISLLLCAGMHSICWETQPSCKLIESGDFLTVTLTKNKPLIEKTVDHPGTFFFFFFWITRIFFNILKFSDGKLLLYMWSTQYYIWIVIVINCLYCALGVLKKKYNVTEYLLMNKVDGK